MGSVTFVGLGLEDERGMTLGGLEEARRAGTIFIEMYTNVMPRLDMKRLEQLLGKPVQILNRTDIEDDEGKLVVHASENGDVVFFVPGDPMIATTHVSLRLILAKRKIATRIVHSASITSAIAGATGLQSYKFGKSVTVPAVGPAPRSVIDTISENRGRGLHTLLLLDIADLTRGPLTISEAVRKIMTARKDLEDYFSVGAARVGAIDEIVKAARMRKLQDYNFGGPPHCLVVIGRLHFVEAEALSVFCGADESDMEAVR
ncbi:MAG TPA: diphthine synthase [Candidatus Bathyarchaeia archaeon]|nr:diphthine synthase [Candidatus Bathyarchaeia archaeon]